MVRRGQRQRGAVIMSAGRALRAGLRATGRQIYRHLRDVRFLPSPVCVDRAGRYLAGQALPG